MPKKHNSVTSNNGTWAAADFFRVKDLARRRSIFNHNIPSTNTPTASTATTTTSSPPFSPIEEHPSPPPLRPSSSGVSAVFPDLFKLEISSDMRDRSASNPNNPNAPLLTLNLSQPSFLNSTISDNDTPLYTIRTNKNSTRVFRRESIATDAQVCHIRWPSASSLKENTLMPNIIIQMEKTRARPAEDFLKFGPLFNSRKFTLPNYDHSLKWKRAGKNGKNFNLTSKGVKAVIATMEPAVLSAPPRIKIFESVFVKDETRPQAEYRGVPILLIDYIICTALLLVTDKDDYMDFSPAPSSVPKTPGAGDKEEDETSTFHSLLQSPTSPISQPALPEEKLSAVHQWVENVRQGSLSESASSRPSSPAQSLSGPSSSRGGGDAVENSNVTSIEEATIVIQSLPPEEPPNDQDSEAQSFSLHPYSYGYTDEADEHANDGERSMALSTLSGGERRRGSKRNTDLHQMFDSMLVVQHPRPSTSLSDDNNVNSDASPSPPRNHFSRSQPQSPSQRPPSRSKSPYGAQHAYQNPSNFPSPSVPLPTGLSSASGRLSADTYLSASGQFESEFGVIGGISSILSTSSPHRGPVRPDSAAGISVHSISGRPLPRPPTSSLPSSSGNRPPLLPTSFHQFDYLNDQMRRLGISQDDRVNLDNAHTFSQQFQQSQSQYAASLSEQSIPSSDGTAPLRLGSSLITPSGLPLPPPQQQQAYQLRSYSQSHLPLTTLNDNVYQFQSPLRDRLPELATMDYMLGSSNNESEVTLVVDAEGENAENLTVVPLRSTDPAVVLSAQRQPLPPTPSAMMFQQNAMLAPNHEQYQRPIPAKLANEYSRARTSISPTITTETTDASDRYFSDTENALSPSSSLSPSSIPETGTIQHQSPLRAEALDAYTAQTMSRPLPLQVMNADLEASEVASVHSFELPPPSYDSINWSNSNAARRMHAMQVQVQMQMEAQAQAQMRQPALSTETNVGQI